MKKPTNIDNRWKIYLKEGHTTVCLFKKGFTHYNAEMLINHLSQLRDDWVGKFIIKH